MPLSICLPSSQHPGSPHTIPTPGPDGGFVSGLVC